MGLAQFAMGRVDAWLREALGVEQGLGAKEVSVLDPAVGTGVWLSAALEAVRGPVTPRRWLAYDVDSAVLDTARGVLADAARAKGVSIDLHCENTLEVPDPWPPRSNAVRVIVGNPPWAARSLTRGTSLSDSWLEEFRTGSDGAPLSERRTGVLSDDYVRFFRWALEQVRHAPRGAVLAFVTNNSYLDGPVHRGMRAALRAAFDRIEILDLGGNALLSRGAERDENVFGVRVGAALMFGLRLPGDRARRAELRIAKLTGTREHKLAQLAAAQFAPLSEASLEAPWAPRTRTRVARPQLLLSQIFPFHREGVQTNRDAIATARSQEELVSRLEALAQGQIPLSPSRHFDPGQARAALQKALEEGELGIRKLAYRPLDSRVFCSLPALCHRPRPELLSAMQHSSLALLAVRKDRGAAPFRLFAASLDVADACYLSSRSSCRTRVFPSHTPEGEENVSREAREAFGLAAGAVSAESLIAYSLGLLLSSTYRAEQGDALKHDYAAIALPPRASAFVDLAKAGQAFVDALTAPLEQLPAARAQAVVSEAVLQAADLSSPHFDAAQGRLLLGAEAVLEGVRPDAWECVVGQFKVRQTARAPHSTGALRELLGTLRRAEHMQRAHELADEMFRKHFF